jgi:lysophospholipase L1-like esterase
MLTFLPMSLRVLMLAAILSPLLPLPASGQAPGPLVLKDGDRVVLLGSALIEHEQSHGYLETRLMRRFPDASITFRNLGWSGDTVRGDARTSGFQNPDGFARLLKEVKAQRPTVIFIAYGTNESFDGAQGLPGFLKGMENLLDQLAPLKARIILLSPTFHEDLGRAFPDPTERNRNLEQYTAALKKLADSRRLRFVDLFHPFAEIPLCFPRMRVTTNGLLPNERGYILMAAFVEEVLGDSPKETWEVELDGSGKELHLQAAKVFNAKPGQDRLSFDIVPQFLPDPSDDGKRSPLGSALRINGLRPGRYALWLNGREVGPHEAADLDRRVDVGGPLRKQTADLRAAIIKKNALFYRRWRPFNDHERHWGFIGGDFKLYDAEIANLEAEIARLRRPQPLHVEIIKEKAK